MAVKGLAQDADLAVESADLGFWIFLAAPTFRDMIDKINNGTRLLSSASRLLASKSAGTMSSSRC
jgi:hypothetical protein